MVRAQRRTSLLRIVSHHIATLGIVGRSSQQPCCPLFSICSVNHVLVILASQQTYLPEVYCLHYLYVHIIVEQLRQCKLGALHWSTAYMLFKLLCDSLGSVDNKKWTSICGTQKKVGTTNYDAHTVNEWHCLTLSCLRWIPVFYCNQQGVQTAKVVDVV